MHVAKVAARKLVGLFGLEVHRRGRGSSRIARGTMRGCLEQAARNGITPKIIFDVGAADGTRELYEVFPTARHILIEPLVEFEPRLRELVAELGQAEYVLAAAGRSAGEVIINVHPDLVGSSLYREEEDSDVNGVERTVPRITLDQVARERDLQGPYLIKIDAQGSELDVLNGAEGLLSQSQLILLEVSLFEFFKGGPQLHDSIVFMKERGFVVYDIFDVQYRPLDGAMSQVDIAFVPENSDLRRYHFYATREQRRAQNKRLCRD